MKIPLKATLLIVGGLLGCSGQEANRSEKNGEVTLKDVKNEAQDAVKAAGALVEQTKDSYLVEIKQQLQKSEEQIEKLKAKTETLQGAAKQEWHAKISELEIKRANLKKKTEELGSSTESAWSDLKSGIESASKELSEAVSQAADNFK